MSDVSCPAARASSLTGGGRCRASLRQPSTAAIASRTANRPVISGCRLGRGASERDSAMLQLRFGDKSRVVQRNQRPRPELLEKYRDPEATHAERNGDVEPGQCDAIAREGRTHDPECAHELSDQQAQ